MPALGQGLLIPILTKQQLLAAQTGLITGFLPAVILSGLRFLTSTGVQPTLPQSLTLAIPARHFNTALQTVFLAGDVWPVFLPAHGLYARAWRRLFGHHVQEAGEAVGCVNLGRGFPGKREPLQLLAFLQ